ncbi:MAG: AsmA-like C-terminal region-containing protein [Hyphomicrobiaceae bacterium]|nr:AsmA-like C-terminal region-containing protein [Hyphomicrobiaceae bacterium]
MTGDQRYSPSGPPSRRSPPARNQLRSASRASKDDAAHEAGTIGLGRAVLNVAGLILAPILLLALIAGGVGYFRLVQGPVPLQFLVAPVERGINAELGSLRSSIDTIVMMLTDQGGLEFRLVGLRIEEPGGDLALSAPQAAMELSLPALWSLQATPSRIELIEPRLSLAYSEDGGLSLRFASSGAGGEAGSATAAVATGRAPDWAGATAGKARSTAAGADSAPIDLFGLLAPAAEGQVAAGTARTHLKEFGLRDAVVSLEAAGRKTQWQVPRLSVDVSQAAGGSVLSGAARLSTGGRIWSVSFRTERTDATKGPAVFASVTDLMPRMLGEALPQLALLRTLDMPVSGTVRIDLGQDGRPLSSTLDLELSAGRILLPDVTAVPLSIDAGGVHLAYDAADGVIRLDPSTLRWGGSSLTLSGRFAPQAPNSEAQSDGVGRGGGPGGGSGDWRYDIAAAQGVLSIPEFSIPPLPVDVWRATGTLQPQRGRFTLDDLHVAAGGGEIHFAGDVETGATETSARLEAKLGAMPAVAVQALWPRALAPAARQWVGEHIREGRIAGGTIQFVSGRFRSAAAGPQSDLPYRLGVAITAEDIVAEPVKGLPPIHIPRGLVSHEDSGIEVVMPAASATLDGGDRIDLKSGRFRVRTRADGDFDGEVVFAAAAKASAAVTLLSDPFFARLGRIDMPPEKVGGAVTADVALTFPLATDVAVEDVRLTAKARLTDGSVRGVASGIDVKGAAVDFELTDRALDAKGDILIAGVAAKLIGQRIFAAPPDAQPPLRITAVLDSADRRQLGLDLANAVEGDVPVEVTIAPQPGGDKRIRIRAELNSADLAIDSIGWRKPPGRAAYLDSGVTKTADDRVMLSDLTIAGDDIAIEGSLVLDQNNRVQEFSFPRFSLNLITRLSVSGKRGRDGVWKLDVKGPTYDGKEMFRSLFSVGHVKEPSPESKDGGVGVDLSAEIDNVLGFSEVSLRKVKFSMTRRKQQLASVDLTGTLDGGGTLDAQLVRDRNGRRQFVATSTDAGQAFKLVDFYPNLAGGRMRLDVNLDASGAAEKSGVLVVDNFRVLGDPVVSEVVGTLDESSPAIDGKRSAKTRTVRQVFDFERLRAPFSVGHGQFVIEESYVRGPLVGATLRGKADFGRRRIDLGGTYVPLQGLNNAFGQIPLLGELLSGPRKEGIFGVTFAVQGEMDRPQVLVNPLSIVAPGIFREIFQMSPQDPSVQPRGDAGSGDGAIPAAARASSSPPAVSTGTGARRQAVEGWRSETTRP